MGQGLTDEQELVVSVLATAHSQGVEIYITLETYNILTRVLRNSQVARAIIASGEVLYRSEPFKEWLRAVRHATTLTGEDAKVLAYATFGTNISGTILGCDRLVTLDRGLANEFELKKDKLETRLSRILNPLPLQYQKVRLPQVVLLRTDSQG